MPTDVQLTAQEIDSIERVRATLAEERARLDRHLGTTRVVSRVWREVDSLVVEELLPLVPADVPAA